MKFKRFRFMIALFFLLIFVQITILELREEVSLITLLEISGTGLLILLYYFIIKTETALAAKVLENRLERIEKEFEGIEEKLKEEIKLLKSEIIELKSVLEKGTGKKF